MCQSFLHLICLYINYLFVVRRFLAALFLFLLFFVSCGEPSEKGGQAPDVSFVLPDLVEVDPVTLSAEFKVKYSKSPQSSDMLVLKGDDGKSHDCRITDITQKAFTAVMYDGFVSGNYEVFVKRSSAQTRIGSARFILSDGVVPETGSTVYGRVCCNDKGLAGVVLSDGVSVVQTDANGVYQMKSDKKYGYVFVSLPSGYETSNMGVLPLIHQKLTSAASIAERVDFELFEAGDQSNHTILAFGDMHLADRNNDKEYFYEFCSDINAYLSAHKSDKVYAVTLGDMTWDYYWYSNSYQMQAYLSDVNRIKNLTVFHTIGNHDHDMNSAGDFDTARQFMDVLAPDYYSFNIGDVHYVVLDNILCTNNGGGRDHRTYDQKLTKEQLSWLAKDLSYVSKSTPVVLMMHATTSNMGSNATALTSALSGFSEVHFISGHSHKVNNYHGSNWHDHNSGAICADWWNTAYNTKGALHIAQDGSPGGYQIFSVSGNRFEWVFKPTGDSEQVQFRTYDRNRMDVSSSVLMNDVADTYKQAFDKLSGIWAGPSSSNEVYVNVWNYDKDWTISVTENGTELKVTKVSCCDPLHLLTYSAKAMRNNVKPTFMTNSCNHMWKVQATGATSTLEIKVTDSFGNVYTETMKRPKDFSIEQYSY